MGFVRLVPCECVITRNRVSNKSVSAILCKAGARSISWTPYNDFRTRGEPAFEKRSTIARRQVRRRCRLLLANLSLQAFRTWDRQFVADGNVFHQREYRRYRSAERIGTYLSNRRCTRTLRARHFHSGGAGALDGDARRDSTKYTNGTWPCPGHIVGC